MPFEISSFTRARILSKLVCAATNPWYSARDCTALKICSYSSAVLGAGSSPDCNARPISCSSSPSRVSIVTISRSLLTRSLARFSALYSSLWPSRRPRSRAFSQVASMLNLPFRCFRQDDALPPGQVSVDLHVQIVRVLLQQRAHCVRLVRADLECEQSARPQSRRCAGDDRL